MKICLVGACDMDCFNWFLVRTGYVIECVLLKGDHKFSFNLACSIMYSTVLRSNFIMNYAY